VSLDELKELLEAEEARAELRDEWSREGVAADRRRQILTAALGHLDRQLELVRRRRREIETLERELAARRARVRRRMQEL
jgi:hypothetical protein